jgi:hypothetical protein
MAGGKVIVMYVHLPHHHATPPLLPILTSNYKNKNQDDPSLVHMFSARDCSGQEQLQNKSFLFVYKVVFLTLFSERVVYKILSLSLSPR